MTEAVNRAGLAVVEMDYFAARDRQPADYCRQRVRECEIYVAVIGFRYGSVVSGEDVSYTELEFNEATAVGRPRLIFLLHETAGLPGDLFDVDRTRIDGFRRRLRDAGLIHASFHTAEGLELAVFHALKDHFPATWVVPRHLPPTVAHFAGRAAELAVLDGLLHQRDERGGAVVIAAIGGTAGAGKTELAVHWAHRVAERFPDGQLYVDLRGFGPNGPVVEPADALRRFFDALEVAPERIPLDLDAQVGLYRSLLAGRRMLVVLDNARDSAQVRPLLPGAATCLVVVTSRYQLTGLAATDGAHLIDLELLSAEESQDLLARRLGADRIAAEPTAVADVIARCAHLPLALALVAARATSRPGAPLSVLARELDDPRYRWDTLRGDDPRTDTRTVFSWSYHALSPEAARLFRLLGLQPGVDIDAAAAASLAGLTPEAVRPVLAELTRASLLREPGFRRYTAHDLLRAYAAHLVETVDAGADGAEATGRILDHYLHTAHAADRRLDPHADPMALTPPRPGVTPEDFDDQDGAQDWFAEHRSVLVATVEHAAVAGFHRHAWQLAWSLWTFLDRQGHWHDRVEVGRVALVAARHLSDPAAQIRANRYLASAYVRIGRFEEAQARLDDALALATAAGDEVAQAFVHHSFGYLWDRQAQPARALTHAQRALRLFADNGHRSGQADALNSVGWCFTLLGDHQQAIAHCEQALVLLQAQNDSDGLANTWDSLGRAHVSLGQYADAVACYDRALAFYRDTADQYQLATTLVFSGDAHRLAGDADAARYAWQQALSILDVLRHPDAVQVRANLADLDVMTGGSGVDTA